MPCSPGKIPGASGIRGCLGALGDRGVVHAGLFLIQDGEERRTRPTQVPRGPARKPPSGRGRQERHSAGCMARGRWYTAAVMFLFDLQLFASKKGGGSTRNGRDSNAQRLGVKKFGGERSSPGNIIVRQRGTEFYPGAGVGMGKDHTIFAVVEGQVRFHERNNRRSSTSSRPEPADLRKRTEKSLRALFDLHAVHRRSDHRGVRRQRAATASWPGGARSSSTRAAPPAATAAAAATSTSKPTRN